MSNSDHSLVPLGEADVIRNGDGAPDISFLGLVNMHLRHRWLLLLLPIALCATAVAFSLTRPRTYSSVVSMVPQSHAASGLSGLAGIASQFGVQVATQARGDSPAFYEELLGSQALLEAAVDETYEVPLDGRVMRGTLVELLDIKASSPPLAKEEGVRRLRNLMGVSRNRETGVVTLTVRTEYPELSRELTDRMVSLVNTYNVEQRRSQASAERSFIEQRVAESLQELRAAEGALEGFLQQNRQFGRSPELQFQFDRLQQEVVMRQSLYMSLAQAYEQARIEEVRTLPVITVVQPPTLPVRPNPRGTVTYGMLAIILGLVVAWLIALGRELVRRSSAFEQNELREYEQLRQETLHDLRHPFRGLHRAIAGVR